MSTLVEAFLAAFDSNAELVWSTDGQGVAVARFEVAGTRVETRFEETNKNEWRVGFEAFSNASVSENIYSSIRVFSGVFQAVREFLEVQQPEKLVIASKEEALGHLYEEYLEKQDTPLRRMGYRMVAPVRVSPLAEFTIEKAAPSDWKN